LEILEVIQKDKDLDCCISQNHCKRSSCRNRQLFGDANDILLEFPEICPWKWNTLYG